ncbi:TPA_asm: P3 [Scutellaria alphacytorhabdovirus 1]|nr:TPA_asm: P3 [Scutellaria alphacytorhabdovirus 1]
MKGIISVNDARAIVAANGSLTSDIKSSQIYDGKFKKIARKREVNVKILANSDRFYLMRCFPLFDSSDLQEMRSEDSTNKYLHIGCISISIEPLIHHRFLESYGKNINGVCAIVDTTFRNLEQSIISLHKFSLGSKRADFICQPNHCLSLTDENLMRRISVLIMIDSIDVDPGNELFNICVGHITTCTNTLNPSGNITQAVNIALTGTSQVDYKEVGETLQEAFLESSRKGSLDLVPEGEDITTLKNRNFFARLGLVSSPKVTVRKNYVVNLPKPEIKDKSCNPYMPRSFGSADVRRCESMPRNSLDLAIVRCAKEGLFSETGKKITKRELLEKIRADREQLKNDNKGDLY